MATEVQTPEEIVAIILCRRCVLNEVSHEGDMCGECYQEILDQAWANWWDRRAKEAREAR